MTNAFDTELIVVFWMQIFHMRTFFIQCATIFAICVSSTLFAQEPDHAFRKHLEGRWDITISMNGSEVPSWLEVQHSGLHTLVGRFVGPGGSARPISEVKTAENTFAFAIPPQWESEDRYLAVTGSREGDGLKGEITFPDGNTYRWTARRAPALRVSGKTNWGKPIALITGDALDKWTPIGNENQWVVEDGVLRSPKSGANLKTKQKFNNFKLHIEFRYPEGSNSGVYLRGRYEVQISDSRGREPQSGELGGIYGFIAPSEQVAKAPGEWQTYDITLIGRMVTVEANGKLIICNQEIPGITGGALDSNEAEPGPIMLQGDHGPVEYRNIILIPAE